MSIFLLLTAYFQSPKLALVAVAAVPAVLAGVAVALLVTGTTLNIQSFMGAIMAIGVAVSNAILLVTFAEDTRRAVADGPEAAARAAVEGARHRVRPILMTSFAMLAGMVPMALGEGGDQTAPLGRAVIGGLVAATLATLLILPSVFAAVQARGRTRSPSVDPHDGVVSRRHVDTGAYVQAPPAGNEAAAAPLFEVVRTDLVRVFVDVPEADAPFVRDGGPGRVQVQALGEREFQGRVARSSWLLDSRTRTLRTEIDLPNPDGLFRPGMYAYARLPVEHPGVLTLPASAVFHQDDQDWVVRVEGEKAGRTPVRLGLRQGGRVEVLRKQTRPAPRGVSAAWEDFTGSEVIVRDNPSALSDGQEVQTQPGEPMAVARPLARAGERGSGPDGRADHALERSTNVRLNAARVSDRD